MPALLLLCAAQFMVILDITVVNVALPSIQAGLGFAAEDLQWVVTAYTLAFGGLLLLGGRAADLFGRRRIFMAGLGVFTAASLASGLAASQEALLAARALQGVGAAMLSPAALSLVATVFPEGPRRNRALAAWAAIGAGGGAVGVLVGGALTEAFGWEAIFLVNVPFGIAVALAATRVLPAVRPTGRGRMDIAGGATATAGLVALIYGLVEADAEGWGSAQTLGMLAMGGMALAMFAAIQARVADPLVPLGVFRRRATVAGLVLMMAAMGTLVSAYFFSSLYLQQVLGHSALRTGLEFLPMAFGIVVAAHAGSQLIARLGAKPVIAAGLALAAGGALLLTGISENGGYVTDVLPGFLVLAVGVGLAAPPTFIVAMSGAGEHDAGVVSGLTTVAHELGITLVLAVLSTIAATGLGGAALQTAGIADAFGAAAAVAAAGALLALGALRRADVAPGARPAFAAH